MLVNATVSYQSHVSDLGSGANKGLIHINPSRMPPSGPLFSGAEEFRLIWENTSATAPHDIRDQTVE
jgi:hypothetical protein